MLTIQLSCDEAVISRLDIAELGSYGDTLMSSLKAQSAHSGFVASMTMSDDAKMVKERLEAIMSYKKGSRLAKVLSSVLTASLLVGCGFLGGYSVGTAGNGSTDDSLPQVYANSSSVEGLVVGATDLGNAYCVTEQGIYYLRYNKMRYYDLKTNTAKVFCNQPLCLHVTNSCAALYSGSETEAGAAGLAEYGGYVYVMKNNKTKNCVELLQMSLSGEVLGVVFSFDIGSRDHGTWRLLRIQDVFYINDTAWFTAVYQYHEVIEDNGTRYETGPMSSVVMGVSLTDGTCTRLTELPTSSQIGLSLDSSMELVADGYIVLEKTWNSLEVLTRAQFHEASKSGEFAEYASANDPYFEYQSWHIKNNVTNYSLLVYNTKTNEIEVFDEGEYVQMVSEYDDLGYQLPKYLFSGVYKGQFVCLVPDRHTSKSDVYLYNPVTGITTLILEIEAGTLLGVMYSWNSGYTGSSVISDRILYRIEQENQEVTICFYSPDTDETTVLHNDYIYSTFRIRGETASCFIGERFDDANDRGEHHLYIIDKQDYYSGNYTSTRMLRIWLLD